MLVKCVECELQVSDKASSCPHCGYPMNGNIKQRKPKNSNKRRRLPNGFGQISEIKNRSLRNPFRAMVTVGKNINGRPICKPLKPESYFATYNDAYAALVEYNRNPYDLEPSITVKEL
jgi:ribosomal protein L37E